MSRREIKLIVAGLVNVIAFAVWTLMIKTIDVKPVGINGTEVGFSTFNVWFHSITGVNMNLYCVTDWLGLVPVFVCLLFGFIGFIQMIKRKSICKVDVDIICLGVYYVIVVASYLIFEIIPINYRPILINGYLEASYPSSTTLLVLSVMPTLVFQTKRRIKNIKVKRVVLIISKLFSLFMFIGRIVSGVHWITDMIGSVFLCLGLFITYKGVVLLLERK